MNESIYYNVDKIHRAINADMQLTFHYCKWNLNKEVELRRDGKLYRVSPWRLLWDNENYYLIAYDNDERTIKHYRVDKMKHLQETTVRREGKEMLKKLNPSLYTNSLFNMYGGKLTRVTLLAHN